MNQLQSSELVKSLSFVDHPFPVFLTSRNNAFPIQDSDEIPDVPRPINPLSVPKSQLTGEVDEPSARQWLIERQAVAVVSEFKQPGFDTADQGGSYD